MESVTPQPVCAKEAIDLLNCVTENPFVRDKCLRLLDGLRNCVLEKELAEPCKRKAKQEQPLLALVNCRLKKQSNLLQSQ